jgi:hypothetical protein
MILTTLDSCLFSHSSFAAPLHHLSFILGKKIFFGSFFRIANEQQNLATFFGKYFQLKQMDLQIIIYNYVMLAYNIFIYLFIYCYFS